MRGNDEMRNKMHEEFGTLQMNLNKKRKKARELHHSHQADSPHGAKTLDTEGSGPSRSGNAGTA